MRALLLLPFLAIPAQASGEAEWDAFRAEVEAACLALLDFPGEPMIEVNPFGSASYGAALVTMTLGDAQDRMLCIFDKTTKLAELTAPF